MNITQITIRLDERIKDVLENNGPLLTGLYKDAGLALGKKLRARAFLAFAKDEKSRSIDIAAVIELLHAATLAHDDILDNSRLRRGARPLYSKRSVHSSLFYGDYLFAKAFELLGSLNDPALNKEVSSALPVILEGEMLEHSKRGKISLTRKEYYEIIEKKSGVLFGMACKLGAFTRGVKASRADSIYRFGLDIGKAYQMLDDLGDYFTEGEDKENFNDLKEGVLTLPVICLLERCSENEKARVKSIFENRKVKKSGCRTVVKCMEKYGVRDDILCEIDVLLKQAVRLIPKNERSDVKEKFDVLHWLDRKINHA